MPEPLEVALNDLAVIRTTFKTLEAIPEDPDLHEELTSLIRDARGSLMRRLGEHRQALSAGPAGSQIPDLQAFKEQLLQLATKAVSKEDPTFRYEFLPQHPIDEVATLPPPAFIARLFDDLLETVADDCNYADRLTFDRNVFQKLVAVIFCSYVATDPGYYGGDSHP
jgi:hypothetical protein